MPLACGQELPGAGAWRGLRVAVGDFDIIMTSQAWDRRAVTSLSLSGCKPTAAHIICGYFRKPSQIAFPFGCKPTGANFYIFTFSVIFSATFENHGNPNVKFPEASGGEFPGISTGNFWKFPVAKGPQRANAVQPQGHHPELVAARHPTRNSALRRRRERTANGGLPSPWLAGPAGGGFWIGHWGITNWPSGNFHFLKKVEISSGNFQGNFPEISSYNRKTTVVRNSQISNAWELPDAGDFFRKPSQNPKVDGPPGAGASSTFP